MRGDRDIGFVRHFGELVGLRQGITADDTIADIGGADPNEQIHDVKRASSAVLKC